MNRVPLSGKTLEGAVALVTGGASGLGLAVVERLVRCGARVVVLDVQANRTLALAARLPHVVAAPGDVLSARDVAAAVAAAMAEGPLRAVVCCAGLSSARETYNFLSERPHSRDEFSRTVRTAVAGLYGVAAAAAPAMRGGVLLATAGGAATEGARGQASGAAACAGVEGVVRALRGRLAARGVRAAVLSPGLFATPPLAHLPPRVVSFLARQGAWPERLGVAEEFAHAAAALAARPALAGGTFRVDAGNRLFPL